MVNINLQDEIPVTSERIVQMLESHDKDYLIDIPTILINNAGSINFAQLLDAAFNAGVGYNLLALIDVANILEHNDAFRKVLSEKYPTNIVGGVIEDKIFPYHEFRQSIRRNFLERVEQRWNVHIAFTLDDFYKVYLDYHLLPVHGKGLREYFGDALEI